MSGFFKAWTAVCTFQAVLIPQWQLAIPFAVVMFWILQGPEIIHELSRRR
jgi:hypothetical protein